LKVLLTGASGFVGSHILDRLRESQIPTAILFRRTTNRRFLEKNLGWAETREGSLSDLDSLRKALQDATHVIHCAGATKAAKPSGFYEVNQGGTRNLVTALPQTVQRFIHISSLAAAGPSNPASPLSEEQSPRPVSVYGKSKLAGEQEVRERCPCEFVILRPPAVYGPRDEEFLRLFKAVKRHLRPRPGLQLLSLVYVVDLSQAVIRCLTAPEAARKTFYVTGSETVTARDLASRIAASMGGWTLPIPLPTPLMWPLCLGQEILTRVTGSPNVLSLQKYTELRAPAWTCNPARLKAELGVECTTDLEAGIRQTVEWYRENGWL
jgi:nucleoside-diphosphate-sugar epimerase